MNNQQRVRQMMDEGKSINEMSDATGLQPRTVDNYRYIVRHDGEILRPHGRPKKRLGHVKVTLHLQLTPAHRQWLLDNATRLGHRPALLIERLIRVIIADNLLDAVLDDEKESQNAGS